MPAYLRISPMEEALPRAQVSAFAMKLNSHQVLKRVVLQPSAWARPAFRL
jgi:hypothetical protein